MRPVSGGSCSTALPPPPLRATTIVAGRTRGRSMEGVAARGRGVVGPPCRAAPPSKLPEAQPALAGGPRQAAALVHPRVVGGLRGDGHTHHLHVAKGGGGGHCLLWRVRELSICPADDPRHAQARGRGAPKEPKGQLPTAIAQAAQPSPATTLRSTAWLRRATRSPPPPQRRSRARPPHPHGRAHPQHLGLRARRPLQLRLQLLQRHVIHAICPLCRPLGRGQQVGGPRAQGRGEGRQGVQKLQVVGHLQGGGQGHVRVGVGVGVGVWRLDCGPAMELEEPRPAGQVEQDADAAGADAHQQPPS